VRQCKGRNDSVVYQLETNDSEKGEREPRWVALRRTSYHAVGTLYREAGDEGQHDGEQTQGFGDRQREEAVLGIGVAR